MDKLPNEITKFLNYVILILISEIVNVKYYVSM